MAPLNLKTRLLRVIRHTLVTRTCVLITGEESAAVFVAFVIVARCRYSPRPFRIYFSDQFEVHLIAQSKVVTTIAEIESSGVLIAITRHNETGAIALCEGEETIRNGKRQWYVGNHKICRAKRHILSRTHLGSGKGNIKVGMFLVASSIPAMSQIDITRFGTLRYLTGQEAIFLFGIGILYKTFLRLEVERDRIRVIVV